MTATPIPFSVRRTSGALCENCESLGTASIELNAAIGARSIARMEVAVEEIAGMADRLRVLAAQVERQIARHRRGE